MNLKLWIVGVREVMGRSAKMEYKWLLTLDGQEKIILIRQMIVNGPFLPAIWRYADSDLKDERRCTPDGVIVTTCHPLKEFWTSPEENFNCVGKPLPDERKRTQSGGWKGLLKAGHIGHIITPFREHLSVLMAATCNQFQDLFNKMALSVIDLLIFYPGRCWSKKHPCLQPLL